MPSSIEPLFADRRSAGKALAAALQRIELARGDASPGHLDEAEFVLRETIGRVRELSTRLRSSGPGSLEKALSELSHSNPLVRFAASGTELPLPERVRGEVISIATEAVRNALRHAVHPTTVQIDATWGDSALDVSVRDDGRAVAAPEEGLGIRGMRERADSIGATLRVSAAGGFLVTISVPYAGG